MTTNRKILYVGLQDDYGDPSRGLNYEYINFHGTLKHMDDLNVRMFAVDRVLREKGRRAMNDALVEAVREFQPNLCFFVLFTDEIEKSTIRWITEQSGAMTFNWFCDDHWRFHNFSKYWAPLFHWVSTTDPAALDEYRKAGLDNVILSQWAFNHFLTIPEERNPDLDATFVGQVHSSRREIIDLLKGNGIKVQCWGKGWANGRLDHEEMVRIFRRSRINLNFGESSNAFNLKSTAKVFLNRRADDSLRVNTPSQLVRNARVLFRARRPQIKARNFEIPGYGGFLLTSEVDHLADYFTAGKEIVCFAKIDDLVEKIRYYLAHDSEREAIRRAGQNRTVRDHTYEKRFIQIFDTIGLV